MRAILFSVSILVAVSTPAQQPLAEQIRTIALQAHGKVSVACSLPGSSLNCDLDPHAHPPMQSVFKLPLALTILHQVERGKFSLQTTARFRPEDRILPHVHSDLQEKYPEGGVDVPVQELLRLAVATSDNIAADILLRVAGGPRAVDAYIASLGVSGFQLQDNEAELHRDVQAQYRNWFEPAGAVRLLRRINDNSPLSRERTELLLGWMTPPDRTLLLEGDLPAGVRVAHRSGTSDIDNGVAHATNDIGLIPLPDGRRIAVAVFVTDSTADRATIVKVIAQIGKAVYDAGTRAVIPAVTNSRRYISDHSARFSVSGVHHLQVIWSVEDSDETFYICFLFFLCVERLERANTRLAAIARTHANSALAGCAARCAAFCGAGDR